MLLVENDSQNICFGDQIVYKLYDYINLTKPSKILVITDNLIADLHLNYLKSFEKDLTYKAKLFYEIINNGETSKSNLVFNSLIHLMFNLEFTRDCLLVGVGGGVVGDLVNYVSSVYMRGIKVVLINTTILSMVDSSIGGKNGIDMVYGKNLIGSFNMPNLILSDIRFLKTLSWRQFFNGFAEIIKTGCVYFCLEDNLKKKGDEALFNYLDFYSDEIIMEFKQLKYSKNEQIKIVRLNHVIEQAIIFKNKITTLDYKENGLRSVLNYGHSIGHAIEAILSPHILHGECISIGMVMEAEISRSMGCLKQNSIQRIKQVLKKYSLPISLDDKFITDKVSKKKTEMLTIDNLMNYVKLDKKNVGEAKKIVVLSSIGGVVENKAIKVDAELIKRVLCKGVFIGKFASSNNNQCFEISVPGSKSISNRVLVMAAIGLGSCKIKGMLFSDDTQVMLNALTKLNVKYNYDEDKDILCVQGTNGFEGIELKEDVYIYLQNAGTAVRFLASVLCLIKSNLNKTITMSGNDRMKQRPIKPLLLALTNSGCNIKSIEKEGFLPLKITTDTHNQFKGGLIELDSSISSQYVSSLLIASVYATNKTTIKLDNKIISQPYIDITINMLRKFGAIITKLTNNNGYEISNTGLTNPQIFEVEGDASSATYPLAYAALTGTKCKINNLGSSSMQGDANFSKYVLEKMGCSVDLTETTTTVKGPRIGELKGLDLTDMESMTDAFLTATVLSTVVDCETKHETRIVGISNQRVKECNRLMALKTELSKIGIVIEEIPDGLIINNIGAIKNMKSPANGIDCYDDHRVAMSISLLSAYIDVTINDKNCVNKTWPAYFDDMKKYLMWNIKAAEAKDTSNQYNTSKNVVLIGMRGVGKSTLGRTVAQNMNRQFIDTDKVFEEINNTSIKKYVESNGWDQFRVKESEALEQTLINNSNCIISCGGGVVDNDINKTILERSDSIVINITGDVNMMKQIVDNNNDRPQYTNEDYQSVYLRRFMKYIDYADYLFALKYKEDKDESIESNAIQLTKFIRSIPNNDTIDIISKNKKTYFVCLNEAGLTNLDHKFINVVTEGCNAIEIRIDTLITKHKNKNEIIEHIIKQVWHIKNKTDLPIIYTLRSTHDGGSYEYYCDKKEIIELTVEIIEVGIKLRCEIIDVEYSFGDKVLKQISNLRKKYNFRLLVSYHDVGSKFEWNEIQTFELKNKIKYYEPDYYKIVSTASDENYLKKNIKCLQYQNNYEDKLIALNMGEKGIITRVMNSILNPVTHDLLKKSAKGQLTLKQINQELSNLNMLNHSSFYLLGSPISKSPSPKFHNNCFDRLNLPYTYKLMEGDDLSQLMDKINKDDSFRGLSVTIPHKCSVINYLDYISKDAMIIGAVNTVITNRKDDSEYTKLNNKKNNKYRLYGLNTDYLAVYYLIKNKLYFTVDNLRAIVVGAGGTSRACVYALHKLGIKQISVYNRSKSRLDNLINDYLKYNIKVAPLFELTDKRFNVIVDTLPLHVALNKQQINELSMDKTVYVRMAYHSYSEENVNTKIIETNTLKIVDGLDVFVMQASLQFRLFSDLNCPVIDYKMLMDIK